MNKYLRYGWQRNFNRKAHIVNGADKTLCKMENSDQSGPLVGFGNTVPNGRKLCKICKTLATEGPARGRGTVDLSEDEWIKINCMEKSEMGRFLYSLQTVGWKRTRLQLLK